MDKRFNQSRSLFATDRVPPTIFGIPVVSRKEDYTQSDLEFFRRHPEAGGYYDTGDAEDQPELGALKAEGSDETAYQAWRSTLPKELQYEGDYDLRGYYADPTTKKEAVKGDRFTDRYKLPNHETFSDESKYATGVNRFLAGHWKDGKTYVPARMKDFSLAFEEPLEKHVEKGADGKTYYRPHKRSGNDYDVNGYHYFKPEKGELRKHTNDGLISKAAFERSVKATDESTDRILSNVMKHHGVDPSRLDRGIMTGTYDLVFQGGGESLQREKDVTVKRNDGKTVTLKGSPLFHGQMRTFTKNGVPAEDAFGVAMLLEHDSYGYTNYRRFSARGMMIADALSRSENRFARKVAKLYREGWNEAPALKGGSKNDDAYGTNWNRHSSAMRKVSDYMAELKIKHSGRIDK